MRVEQAPWTWTVELPPPLGTVGGLSASGCAAARNHTQFHLVMRGFAFRLRLPGDDRLDGRPRRGAGPVRIVGRLFDTQPGMRNEVETRDKITAAFDAAMAAQAAPADAEAA